MVLAHRCGCGATSDVQTKMEGGGGYGRVQWWLLCCTVVRPIEVPYSGKANNFQLIEISINILPHRSCHIDPAISILPYRSCHFDPATSILPLRSCYIVLYCIVLYYEALY